MDAAERVSGELRGAGPLLVVLSGPSGAGKDAVRAELLHRGDPFHFAVTATTRPPREGEVDGVDYYFLSPDEFRSLLEQGGLIEHEQYANGHYYGVPRSQIHHAVETGRDVIIRTDVRGVASIKQFVPAAISIFVYPSSLEVLRHRLEARRSETPGSIRSRLELATAELARIGEFDYAVLNEDGALDRAVDQTEAIIAAEHCRVGRRPIS
jgi:guanylate kinase